MLIPGDNTAPYCTSVTSPRAFFRSRLTTTISRPTRRWTRAVRHAEPTAPAPIIPIFMPVLARRPVGRSIRFSKANAPATPRCNRMVMRVRRDASLRIDRLVGLGADQRADIVRARHARETPVENFAGDPLGDI